MDFKRLTGKAKELVEKRGGTESLKQDASQLREIAKRPGSVGDKAKAAMAAIKDPGADERPTQAAPPEAGEHAGADETGEGAERGRGRHGGGGHDQGGQGGGPNGPRRGRGGAGDGADAV